MQNWAILDHLLRECANGIDVSVLLDIMTTPDNVTHRRIALMESGIVN